MNVVDEHLVPIECERHVDICMKANRPDNAASWIERLAGELDDDHSYGKIDPDSIRWDERWGWVYKLKDADPGFDTILLGA